jgi:hypothetical protein
MIGRIDSLRIVDGKESDLERRYCTSSRAMTASELVNATRVTWGTENKFHWVFDVTMREGASQLLKDHSLQNLSLLGKIAFSIIRAGPSPARQTYAYDAWTSPGMTTCAWSFSVSCRDDGRVRRPCVLFELGSPGN